MRRIFPAHAYGPGPRAACFWTDTAEPPDHPAARGEITCDVAVIGAGFTGLSAALHLAEAGEDVRVLEAETVGWGASGRNGGFCCLGGSAASDAMLRHLYGEDARRDWRRTEMAAVGTVHGLIHHHRIDADTHSEGETVLAGAEELRVKESDRIQVMADGLAQLGVRSEVKPDGIVLKNTRMTGGTVHSHGDHRIAMAFAVASLRAEGDIIINDCANVATSFPNFVDLAVSVGLQITVGEGE